jgi:hypothetical protein
MTDLQVVLAHAVKLALVAVLIGLFARDRARLCWSFVGYAAVVLACNVAVSFWPGRFYNASFWVLKQGAYDALKMAVALELAWRAFEAFPGAMRTARLAGLGLLAVSTVALGAFTPPSSYLTLWDWQPGVATAALWLLTGTALLVVWYQVPVHDWQRAIMLGLAPYLLVFVTLIGLLHRHGWKARPEIGVLDSAAYLALAAFWAWMVWQREPAALAPAEARP